MKIYGFILISLCLLVTGCGAHDEPESETPNIVYKWPQECAGYGNETTDNRVVTQHISPDGKFGFRVCGIQPVTDNRSYRGPVALQVLKTFDGTVLAKDNWPSSNASMQQVLVGTETYSGFYYTDGIHQFHWIATASQMIERN